GPDWDELWQTALIHGVAYFIHRHLNQLVRQSAGTIRLPDTFSVRARKELWQEKVHTLGLVEFQQRLAAECAAVGLPVLWLKGLALSEQLYGCPEARGSGDLDVLVEPARAGDLAECLRRLGGTEVGGEASAAD